MKHFRKFENHCDALGDLFQRSGTEVKFAPGAAIADQSSQCETVYRVLRGCVRSCIYSVDGDRKILQFAGAGDFLGLGDVTEWLTSVEAVDMVVLAALPRRIFEAELEKDAALQCQVREHLAEQIRSHASLFVLTAQTSAVDRVGLFLKAYASRRKSDDFISLPMCRRDIADHLGLSMETVSRAFSALRASGVIDMRGAGFFRIASGEPTSKELADAA